MQEYKILTGYTVFDLEDKVRLLLSLGWTVAGGPFKAESSYAQALVREALNT